MSGSALMLRERGGEQGAGGGSRPERRKPRSVSGGDQRPMINVENTSQSGA